MLRRPPTTCILMHFTQLDSLWRLCTVWVVTSCWVRVMGQSPLTVKTRQPSMPSSPASWACDKGRV